MNEKEHNMSATLGHIHYWLYKKIQLIVTREQLIADRTRTVIDSLSDELHQMSLDTYGTPIDPTTALETIIDHSNIHGWLSNQIQIASVREATFIKDLLDCVDGKQALPTISAILASFAVQGKACAAIAKEQLSPITAETIYKELQNFYVNGMPCDGGDQIITQTADTFSWIGNHRLQLPYWKTAGVDPKFMALAYQTWFESFVKELSPTHTFTVTEDNGEPIYTIKKE